MVEHVLLRCVSHTLKFMRLRCESHPLKFMLGCAAKAMETFWQTLGRSCFVTLAFEHGCAVRLCWRASVSLWTSITSFSGYAARRAAAAAAGAASAAATAAAAPDADTGMIYAARALPRTCKRGSADVAQAS